MFIGDYKKKVEKTIVWNDKILTKYAGKVQREAKKILLEEQKDGPGDVVFEERIFIHKNIYDDKRPYSILIEHPGNRNTLYTFRRIGIDHDHDFCSRDLEMRLNSTLKPEILSNLFIAARNANELINNEMLEIESIVSKKKSYLISSFINDHPEKVKFISKKYLISEEK